LCFVFAIIGRATINLPDDGQRTLCLVPSASETNRRQAVAGHGIERRQRVERGVDLWFIAVCG